MNPDYMGLFTRPSATSCWACVVMMLIGFAWMKKTIKIEI